MPFFYSLHYNFLHSTPAPAPLCLNEVKADLAGPVAEMAVVPDCDAEPVLESLAGVADAALAATTSWDCWVAVMGMPYDFFGICDSGAQETFFFTIILRSWSM